MAELRKEPAQTRADAVETPPRGHSLALKDRRHLALTGVTRIISCDGDSGRAGNPAGQPDHRRAGTAGQ